MLHILLLYIKANSRKLGPGFDCWLIIITREPRLYFPRHVSRVKCQGVIVKRENHYNDYTHHYEKSGTRARLLARISR